MCWLGPQLRRAEAVALLSLLLGLVGGPRLSHARAQAAQSGPQTSLAGERDVEREYQRAIATALSEYQLEHWDEAEALFARAHALKPSARTERGIGLAAFENRKYALAVSHLHSALVDSRRPLTARQRKEVERALAQASTFVARMTVSVEPQNAALTLDGGPLLLAADGELLLDPGEHELVASAPGHEQRSVRIEAAGGMRRAVQIRLRSFLQLNGEAAQAEQPGLRWTWVAAAGVPVFGALALGFWLSGQDQLDDIAAACRVKAGCSEGEIAQRVDHANLHAHATWTNVFLALTIAAGGSAATLFAIESGADGSERAPAAAIVVAPGAVTVQGRF
jgi:hypothetical protein